MGHILVTGNRSLVLRDSNSRTARVRLTSVVCTPRTSGGVSAWATLYNATAATANTEFMVLRCGTSSETVVWSDKHGIEINANILWVWANCSLVTLVWS